MSYKVSSADLNQIVLSEQDSVKSVLQNVAVILATRKGTVPLHRDFGLSQKFLDRPINVAQSLLYSEIKEAVEEFEPRAEVLNVTFAMSKESPSVLIPTVEVKIIE